jgi:DHA2 family multidrug resistance protein
LERLSNGVTGGPLLAYGYCIFEGRKYPWGIPNTDPVTRREQFHDFEIGAYINAYRPVVQERVHTLATTFFNKGYDAVTATNQAYGQINDVVRREASVMAFNDAFLIVGISLLIGAVLVWLCQKTRAKEGTVAH